MSKQFHGVTSLGLVAVATIIAAVALFKASWLLGAVYLVMAALASSAIVYAFCAKCPSKACCGHVFPGKVAMTIDRQPGPYTGIELAVLGLALLGLIGLPQLWLWRYAGLFVAYWALNAVALVQIRTVVCRACDNRYCPARPQ